MLFPRTSAPKRQGFLLSLHIILCGLLVRALDGRVLFQLCVAVLLSISAIGIMTTLLLYSQHRQHEKWVRAQRIFIEEEIRAQRLLESKQRLKEKERLLEFLRKLCDAVKDKNILPEYIYKEITNE